MSFVTEEKEYDYLFKVLVIGDSGCGKTCLVSRFSDKRFDESYVSTIGIDFTVKTIDVDGKIFKVQMWDTAGQERFRTITTSYYRGAHGIIMVYDVTDKNSFENMKMWLNEIERYASENVVKFMIGNKTDLATKREVTNEEAKQFAEKMDITHFETSAKTSNNFQDILNAICKEIGKSVCKEPVPQTVKPAPIVLPATSVKENSCCF